MAKFLPATNKHDVDILWDGGDFPRGSILELDSYWEPPDVLMDGGGEEPASADRRLGLYEKVLLNLKAHGLEVA